jgi:hypothetical protein
MSESANSAVDGVENRRFHRSTVLWPANLHVYGKVIDCVVFNISANGAKIICKEAIPDKTPVTLSSTRFGEFPGEIVWASGTNLGIRFAAAPTEVAKAVDKLPLLPSDDAAE